MNRRIWLPVVALIVSACSIGKIGNGLETEVPNDTPYLSGRTASLSGQPLSGVRVEAGDASAVSDGDGYWNLPLAGALPDTVTYFRRGFAPHTDVLFAHSGSHLDAKLIPALATRTFDVAAGGELAVDRDRDGAVDLKLTFPPGFLAGVDSVEVSVGEVAAGDPEAVRRFPGTFVSRSAGDAGAQRALVHSYGALNVSFHQGDVLLRQVELAAPVGVELNLGDMSGFANGDLVDMSWLDTSSGDWIKDGQGIVVVQNGIVVVKGQVEHFTWWNFERTIEDQSCVRVKLAADPAEQAFAARFELVVEGASYLGSTPPVTFDANGIAAADGWREQDVDVYYRYGGAGVHGLTAPTSAGLGIKLSMSGDCQTLETPLDYKAGSIAGIVQDDAKQAVTDAIVAIAELGVQARTNPSGYFQFRDVPWHDAGVPLTVRALAPGLRIAPVRLANAAAETIVNLSASVDPYAPWFVAQTLSDSQPTTDATVTFSFTVQDDRSGLTWTAVPSVGQIDNVSVNEADDGSVYQLKVTADWRFAAAVDATGPSELYLRVEDASGLATEWVLHADWQ